MRSLRFLMNFAVVGVTSSTASWPLNKASAKSSVNMSPLYEDTVSGEGFLLLISKSKI